MRLGLEPPTTRPRFAPMMPTRYSLSPQAWYNDPDRHSHRYLRSQASLSPPRVPSRSVAHDGNGKGTAIIEGIHWQRTTAEHKTIPDKHGQEPIDLTSAWHHLSAICGPNGVTKLICRGQDDETSRNPRVLGLSPYGEGDSVFRSRHC